MSPRGEAVPLHPEAAAFAAHYGFVIDVLAAYRPTGKGRVERQVAIVRDHVLAGRTLRLAGGDGRGVHRSGCRSAARSVHRTHGELIGVRAAAGPRRAAAAAARCPTWSASGTCAGSGGTA